MTERSAKLNNKEEIINNKKGAVQRTALIISFRKAKHRFYSFFFIISYLINTQNPPLCSPIYLRCDMPCGRERGIYIISQTSKGSLYRILHSKIYRVAEQHIAKKTAKFSLSFCIS